MADMYEKHLENMWNTMAWYVWFFESWTFNVQDFLKLSRKKLNRYEVLQVFYEVMAQCNFSGTSLLPLLLGGPTLVFADCLLCWLDIDVLYLTSSIWKKVDTSSALHSNGLLTSCSVSSSWSESSDVTFHTACHSFLLLTHLSVFSLVSKNKKGKWALNLISAFQQNIFLHRTS